ATGGPPRFALVPAAHALLPVHSDFRFVGRPHANVTMAAVNRDARVGRHGLRGYIEVARKVFASQIDAPIISDFILQDIHAANGSDQSQKPNHQKNLSGGHPSRASLTRARSGGAFVELDRTPENQ